MMRFWQHLQKICVTAVLCERTLSVLTMSVACCCLYSSRIEIIHKIYKMIDEIISCY